MQFQWESDPPREYRAKPGPGWSILVCLSDMTGIGWEWEATYRPDGELGVRVLMSGPAKDAKEGIRLAEEAVECIGLAMREFKHHAGKTSPDGPPPFE